MKKYGMLLAVVVVVGVLMTRPVLGAEQYAAGSIFAANAAECEQVNGKDSVPNPCCYFLHRMEEGLSSLYPKHEAITSELLAVEGFGQAWEHCAGVAISATNRLTEYLCTYLVGDDPDEAAQRFAPQGYDERTLAPQRGSSSAGRLPTATAPPDPLLP